MFFVASKRREKKAGGCYCHYWLLERTFGSSGLRTLLQQKISRHNIIVDGIPSEYIHLRIDVFFWGLCLLHIGSTLSSSLLRGLPGSARSSFVTLSSAHYLSTLSCVMLVLVLWILPCVARGG